MSKKIIFLILIFLLGSILRLYKFGINPPSLYWDEASIGYNAFSISTSLKDEHGEYLPLSRFIAFGDYKPPGYIYAAVPSVFLFGLSEFSVRFPSLIAGLLMIVCTFYLCRELFKDMKVAYLASFFLSISPWSILFSRAAFESHLAALFNLLGIYFFLRFKKHAQSIFFSILFFVLSFYTFNANRIIAPLLLLSLCLFSIPDVVRKWKWCIAAIVFGFLLILPSYQYLKSRESRLRYEEVSIFRNLKPIEIANKRIEREGGSFIAKVLNNRRTLFALDFASHYLDNFTGRFLFTHGDANPRLGIQEMGLLYIWEIPFLLIGFYQLIIRKHKSTTPLLLWMLIAPIPAGVARETPHALRILSILPTFQIIISYGLYKSFSSIQRNIYYYRYLFIIVCTTFLLLFNIYYFLHLYFIHYPVRWSGEWQYGYKQMVEYVVSRMGLYDHIVVTEALGRPYIYFAFYQQIPNDTFRRIRMATRDWFGFWNVLSLGKIMFGTNNITGISGRILLVTTQKELPPEFHILKSIYNLSGEKVFVIGERE